jgi:hypothetical protein
MNAFKNGFLKVVELLLGKWADVEGTESRQGRREVTNIIKTYRTTAFHLIISNNDIFQQLKELLNDTHIGTNNLLNVSIDFQELKKAHFYWKLTKHYSLTYYCSSSYREHITMLINSKMQLSVNVSRCSGIVDVSALGGVHTLDLHGCWGVLDVSALGHVHDLDLNSCDNLVDVSALGGVHTLNISHCRHVVDITALVNVYTLYHDIDDDDDDNDDH